MGLEHLPEANVLLKISPSSLFGMESGSSYTYTMCTIYILLFWFPIILCLQSKLPSMTFSPNSTTFDFYTFIPLSPYIFITQNMHTLILSLDTKTYSCPFLKCEIFFSFLEAIGHPSNPLFCLQALCFRTQNIGSVEFPIICIFQWLLLKGQKTYPSVLCIFCRLDSRVWIRFSFNLFGNTIHVVFSFIRKDILSDFLFFCDVCRYWC